MYGVRYYANKLSPPNECVASFWPFGSGRRNYKMRIWCARRMQISDFRLHRTRARIEFNLAAGVFVSECTIGGVIIHDTSVRYALVLIINNNSMCLLLQKRAMLV